jgi:hypothetical protein
MYLSGFGRYSNFISDNLTHKKKHDFESGEDSKFTKLRGRVENRIIREYLSEEAVSKHRIYDSVTLSVEAAAKAREQMRDSGLRNMLLNFSAVDSVEDASCEYYDLTVEENAAYFAGVGKMILVHNTGTGSVFPAIKIAQEYMKSINKDFKKTVGVIATLPSRAESPAVFGNAVDALKELCALADSGEISPLVLVDNQKVVDMFGGASVLDAWGKANKNIAALFNVFNELAAQNDDHVVVTFDPEDYKSVLKSGILGFGRSKLIQVSTPTAIAEAVRANVKQGLLVDGLDISKATSAAGVLVASEDNMQAVPQDALESAFGALSRMLDPGPKTKLHRGVIISPSQPVTMYVLISGLGAPEKKIAEMEIKAGRVYP